MAKNYLDLVGLSTYNGLLKTWVSAEDAKKITKIASAEGAKVVASKANGEVEESTLAVADVATKAYADNAASTAADAVADDLQALDDSLAAVAKSGAAADVAVADADGNFTASTVEGVLAEIADNIGDGVESKTVYLKDESSGQDSYAKVYGLYQGSDAEDMTKNVSLGKINIPLDKVVKAATLVTEDGEGNEGYFLKIEFQNDAGIVYVDLTVLADVYTGVSGSEVAVTVDGYNISAAVVEISGSKITDGTISTSKIADDAVTADKIAIAAHTESQAAGADGLTVSVTTTDGQVSGVSASIAAETYEPFGTASSAISGLNADVSQEAGTDGLALSVTEVAGKITAISGSIAAGTYETAGSVASAIADLDATVSQTAGTDGLAISVVETDGKLTSVTGSIAPNTYEPYGIGSIATEDINALFASTEE